MYIVKTVTAKLSTAGESLQAVLDSLPKGAALQSVTPTHLPLFHDGVPVTSGDVLYTVVAIDTKAAAAAAMSMVGEMVESMDADSRRELTADDDDSPEGRQADRFEP